MMNSAKTSQIQRLRDEFHLELVAIKDWWGTCAIDEEYGGFAGEVSNEGVPRQDAKKGAVLNARILWFFSEASLCLNDKEAKDLAHRAYDVLKSQFTDKVHGGLFWSIEPDGAVLEPKKQTYAQAFGIYAYCAYYKLTGDIEALDSAKTLFDIIETRCTDRDNNGYHEALSQNWAPLDDVRLSEFDSNFPFSMNTHLHVLEAYTELQKHAPSEAVRTALVNLIHIHEDKILHEDGAYCRLFFDRNWNDYSNEISHGHDIEASWLIHEACLAVDDPVLAAQLQKKILKLADTCFETGFANREYVYNETEINGPIDKTSIWWVQAEAIVGFLNSYEMCGKVEHLSAVFTIWDFTKRHHIDHEYGEWRWSALVDGAAKIRPYKCGMWKAPYHNGRSMIHGIRLIDKIQKHHTQQTITELHSESSFNRRGQRA